MRVSVALAAAGLATLVSSADPVAYIGFNSDSTFNNGTGSTVKLQADWEKEFNISKNLAGFSGKFNAVRLSSNIQPNTKSDPIAAFPAAISTKTFLLLTIGASGVDSIDPETSALKQALDKYGKDLADLVIGVAIGSEDLYRSSVIGVKNGAGTGSTPTNITNFIKQFRQFVNGTLLASVPIGHIDTWDVWGNTTNSPVLDAVDWVGVDAFPYYENSKCNSIENAAALFDNDYNAALASAKGKPIWITQTGWPQGGPSWDQAVSNVSNAASYWANVGCRKLFGKVPTFWMSLRNTGSLNFGITDANFTTTPSFNLTCPSSFAAVTFNCTAAAPTSTTTTITTINIPTTTVTGSTNSPTATKPSSATALTLSPLNLMVLLVSSVFFMFL
jgi:glucan endo-1,3-beta-D-glucosidase